MISDIIIIGAGISGLYLGLELLKMKKTVSIFEKSNRIGGRIFTKTYQNIPYESGAGRFSNTHTKLLNLFKKYNLDKKIIPLDKAKTKIIYNQLNYTNNIDDYYTNNIDDYYSIIFSEKSKYTFIQLLNMTTYDFLCKIFTKPIADHFIKLYGYRGEIYNANALCGINMFELDYKTKTFYALGGGLQQLVENVQNDYVNNGGKLYKNSIVKNILNNNQNNFQLDITNLLNNTTNSYFCNQLILAIPPKDLNNLNPSHSLIKKAISGLVPITLLRIYFLYKEPNEKLSNIKKVISDLDINYIIPINNNIIMISYSDTEIAKKWFYLYHENKSEFINKLLDEFKIIINKNLDKPDDISLEYWENGVHVWAKSQNYYDNYNSIINPCSNLYLANEAYSKNQGWIESSLEVADDVLDRITKNH